MIDFPTTVTAVRTGLGRAVARVFTVRVHYQEAAAVSAPEACTERDDTGGFGGKEGTTRRTGEE